MLPHLFFYSFFFLFLLLFLLFPTSERNCLFFLLLINMTYTDFFAIYFFDPTIIQIQKTANLKRQKKKIKLNKICIIFTFFHSAPRCISSLRYYYIEFIRQKKNPRFVRVYTPVNTFLIEAGKEDFHQICSKL